MRKNIMITSDFDNNLLLCKGMIYKIGSFPGDVKQNFYKAVMEKNHM